MDLVSIIVPVYNSENLLDRCILSIINQTYKNMEIILVNDGSKDTSLKVCQSYSKKDLRVKVIDQANSGVSGARNKGIENATGKWICFVDADDYLDNDFIASMMQYTIEYKADLVVSGVRENHNNLIKEYKHNGLKVINSKIEREELISALICYKHDKEKILNPQILGYPVGKIFKRRNLSNRRFRTDISIREDALFNIEFIINSTTIVITDLVKYNYVLQNNSASVSYHADYSEEVVRYNQYCKEYCQYNNSPIEDYYIGVLYSYMMWMKLYVMNRHNNRNYKEKINILKKTFYDNNWSIAFSNVPYSTLPVHYKVLKWLFNHKKATGIVMIYYISYLRS